jgi:cytochrome c oxidase cbb3-type subunit 3
MIAAKSSTVPAKPRAKLWLLAVSVLATVLLGIAMWRWSGQAAVLRADPEAVLGNPQLRGVALDGGKKVYESHCASCHGSAGTGDKTLGAPDFTDAEHLYGTGTVAQTEDIARYGIRAGNKRGWNLAVMPGYALKVPDAAEPLPRQTPAQIEDLVQYVLSFTGRATDDAAASRGASAYTKAGCWDCHGRDLGGDPAIGAPSLTDDIWLYGGGSTELRHTLRRGRAGMSPAFGRTLSPAQLRNVAVYVASLAQPVQDQK